MENNENKLLEAFSKHIGFKEEEVNIDTLDEASKDRFIDKTDLEDWQKDALKSMFKSSPQLDNQVDWNKSDKMSWKDWESIILSHADAKGRRQAKRSGITKNARDRSWDTGE